MHTAAAAAVDVAAAAVESAAAAAGVDVVVNVRCLSAAVRVAAGTWRSGVSAACWGAMQHVVNDVY